MKETTYQGTLLAFSRWISMQQHSSTTTWTLRLPWKANLWSVKLTKKHVNLIWANVVRNDRFVFTKATSGYFSCSLISRLWNKYHTCLYSFKSFPVSDWPKSPVFFFLLMFKFGQFTSFVYNFLVIRRKTYRNRKLKKQKIVGGDFMWLWTIVDCMQGIVAWEKKLNDQNCSLGSCDTFWDKGN